MSNRSDASLPSPTQKDIDYLVPGAAEEDGKPAILQYLFSQGGTISERTTHIATSPEIFQILMKHGWKIDNNTPGSHLSDLDIVCFFLSHGADPTIPNAYSIYDIERAALYTPLETVKLLLSNGAPVGPGSRALNAAAQGDASDRIIVMECLLDHGADINALALDFMGPSEAGQSILRLSGAMKRREYGC
ncbi:hypothetical protein OEA41_005938 [Lepraria neglecta]|uniref:Ankyrin n=1 Tax=Lepraria neglecta TaxID=209136 RepID=A0AAE0DK20_9LECA|nr:hypothetical protein OEA41_005938 [Lepraria neglecta]